jgi:hypothetical protein
LNSGRELAPAEQKEYDRLEKIIQAKEKEKEDLKKRRDLIMELVQSIERGRDELYQRLDTVTDTQEKAQINAELVRVRQDKASAMADWKRVGEAIERIDPPYAAQNKVFDKIAEKKSGLNGDNMFRLQMAFLYAATGSGVKPGSTSYSAGPNRPVRRWGRLAKSLTTISRSCPRNFCCGPTNTS